MASCSSRTKKKKAKGGPNWLDLPRDITQNILQRLSTIEIVTSACQVCPLWWTICKEPLMWRTIHMGDNDRCPYYNMDLVKICRYAVERSCSHLKDIEIVYFCTDDLLKYIAECGSNLWRIRLTKCQNILHKQFSEVAHKFPLLEELDISFSNLSEDSLEVIGRCCPLLKSLKFSRNFFSYFKLDDAFAIAKTMPKLRHLSMIGNTLTNDELLVILDRCPLLESLDLRICFNLDLSGSSRKRCRDQIKDLILPTDIDEYCDHDYYDFYFPELNDNLDSYL